MNKIRLVFKGITEIVGGEKLGLIILTDVAMTRQIAIVCDSQMEYQFGIRLGHTPIRDVLLPEVLCKILKASGTINDYEVLISDIVDGEYKTVLLNNITYEMISIRSSDAILLSYISRMPLYIEERLMNRQSLAYQENSRGMAIPINSISDVMLDEALEKAIENEEYEMASYLRDEKNRRKSIR